MAGFYFERFEDRRPYDPVAHNEVRKLFFHFFSILTLFLGFSYLNWRWSHSLNPDALWFAIPLAAAETLSFVSTILFVITHWSNRDPEEAPPVHYLSDIEELDGRDDRPVRFDVFIATYNEDVELVRLSIADAKKMRYPFADVPVRIHVLDDGRRDGRDPARQNMRKVAEEEEVHYLSRNDNRGYKAGNLKNALENTSGDLFVILDADTRPFPELLVHTTGYFRNRKVAWVQTPQWFYDVTEERPLSEVIRSRFPCEGIAGKVVDLLFGRITTGKDIFGNDPRLFYDVILRKRNFYNASFCCGAGSIHRRDAIMTAALKDFSREVDGRGPARRRRASRIREPSQLVLEKEIIPFKFHASEDIYTSMMLHADPENRWESILHPRVECKMLSPQDLDTWIKQRKRYAAGSLDIAFKDNPLFKEGLTWGQRVCYLHTIWSYFAPLWILVFLLSPLIFFFTLTLPVQAYSFEFFKYFLSFQVAHTLTITLGCWGINTRRGEQYYIAGFWYMLESLFTVICRKKVMFNVTSKSIRFTQNTRHILPHAIIIVLGITGILFNIALILGGKHTNLPGFAANAFWCLFNLVNLSIIVRAAYWKNPFCEEESPA